MNADLTLFVRESLARGLPRAAIRERLLEAGWRPEEVEVALAAFAEVDFPVPVPRRRPYLSAREAFLYLVLFATLYITAFNTGVVLFTLVGRWLPDVSRPAFEARAAAEALRNGTAALIIAFPIFLFVSSFIGRAMAREPEKRGSKVRKWLTYLTLFVTALILIGDLTFLVSRLLSGEIPARVLLKVLVVFAIAGTVFGHYLADLRREERDADAPARGRSPLAWSAGVAVVAVIAAGLVGSGSPRRERLRSLDAQRVSELMAISRAIEWYVEERGRVPGSLEDLMAQPDWRGVRSFRDPVTKQTYRYRATDSLAYELCATFDSADSLAGPGTSGEPAPFWKHPAGPQCFPVRVPRKVRAAP